MGSILDLFVGGFGALWVPLGSLLGSLEALLGGLRTQKPSKTEGFLRFLKMQLFGSLKLLMALLGSSCPLFGRSDPKMGPKIVPKNAPKKKPRLSIDFFVVFFVKMTCLQHKFQEGPVLRPKMDQHFCTKFKRDLQEKPR